MITCDLDIISALALGGAVAGGGGGGGWQEGLKFGQLALELGTPLIATLEEIAPTTLVLTVAVVGAPAARDKYVKPTDFIKAVTMIAESLGVHVGGFVTNEMGGMASLNGLLQAAFLGLPVIDAPCNGRAHPLSVMGGMGLHKMPSYTSIQAACGGETNRRTRVEILVKGALECCSMLIRQAAIQAGGAVAVARNPVEAGYLSENAAVNALGWTLSLGKAMLKAEAQGSCVEEEVAKFLRGEIVTEGYVTHIDLQTQHGFDIGLMKMNGNMEIVILNEYMLLEFKGQRLYTFPDLITTFDAVTHKPVTSAEIRKGMKLSIIATKKDNLILGKGMFDIELYRKIEETIGKPIIPYVFGGAGC